VVVELVPVDHNGFAMATGMGGHDEEFVPTSQVVLVRCYSEATFSQKVRKWGAELWAPLFSAAHMRFIVEAGRTRAQQWSPKTGGVITVVKTAEGKWYLTHPYDDDKLFDRPHGFSEGTSSASSVPAQFKKPKPAPK
jgi:hypothetical protein